MPDLRSFFAELKRRKVARTAGVYIAVAWTVVGVADLLMGLPLGLPSWTLTLVVTLAVLGLPLVLTLEWAYEVTRDGVRRTSDSTEAEAAGSRWAPRLAFGAFLIVALGVTWWRVDDGPDPPPPPPDGAEARIAILPCRAPDTVEGAWVGESVAEFVTTLLYGTPLLDPVPSQTLLAYVGREGVDVGDPAAARGLAAHFGAGTYFQCRVLDSERGIRVSAALYRVAGGPDPIWTGTVGPDDLQTLIERLAARLLSAVGGSVSGMRSLADVASDSVAALKAYHAGQAAYREGSYDVAQARFREAVAVDSTFALAHYRLARAAGWAEDREEAEEAILRARATMDRSSPHDRALIEAWAVYHAEGRHAEGVRRYREITAGYADDAEAWYELSEVLFHRGWLLGAPISEAEEALRNADALSPTDYGDVLFHLSNIAAARGDTSELRMLTQRHQSLHGPREFLRGQWILNMGSSAERDSLIQSITDGGPLNLFLADVTRSLPVAERAFEAFTRQGVSAPIGALGHTRLAGTRVTAGRWREARESLARAAAIERDLAMAHEGYFAIVAPPALVAADLAEIAERLESWEAGTLQEPHPRLATARGRLYVSFSDPHPGLAPWLRLYFLGLLEARLGRTDAALERARALREAEAPPILDEWRGDLETIIRAEVRRTTGDPEGALATLADAPLWTVYRLDERYTPILGHFYPVFLRAELLGEMGRWAEALRWYDALSFPFFTLSNGLGTRILAGQAAALEALGRLDEARDIRERVRERWSQADVPLGFPEPAPPS